MTFSTGSPVKRVGGRLALDFLNTADWTAAGEPHEDKIETLADVAAWAEAAGVGAARPPEDAAAFRALRARLRPAFTGGDGEAEARAEINRILRSVSGDPLPIRGARPAALAEIVAIDAASLLADPQAMERLKLCPGDDCGWLFIDETKNGRRRWCMMASCGNRAKARRHYERTRGG